jgi:hypothetical protein
MTGIYSLFRKKFKEDTLAIDGSKLRGISRRAYNAGLMAAYHRETCEGSYMPGGFYPLVKPKCYVKGAIDFYSENPED